MITMSPVPPATSGSETSSPKANPLSMGSFRLGLLMTFLVTLLPMLALAIFLYFDESKGSQTQMSELFLTLGIVTFASLCIGILLADALFITRVRAMQDSAAFKSDLLALALHQLYTPLTTLRWTTEILEEKKSMTKSEREKVDTIEHATEQLLKVAGQFGAIDDTLSEGGQPHQDPVDLAKLARDTVGELKKESDEKKQMITVKSAPTLVTRTDRTLSHLVLHNLLSNAIKYTPASGKIVVSLVREEFGIRVSVADNGKGIPAEEQGAVFGYGYRASNARKAAQGMGIGMHLTKIVVEFLGGSIGFTSKENAGSTFWFTLPMR
jgi:signal transduction histidine kinase